MAILDRSVSTLFQLTVSQFVETLTVNTDVMRQKAAAVEGRIQEMQNAFASLEETVQRTQNYWIGEAGDAHRAYFEKKKPEIEEALKRLSEHVQDLYEMAAVYDNVVRDVTQISKDLPSDVIV